MPAFLDTGAEAKVCSSAIFDKLVEIRIVHSPIGGLKGISGQNLFPSGEKEEILCAVIEDKRELLFLGLPFLKKVKANFGIGNETLTTISRTTKGVAGAFGEESSAEEVVDETVKDAQINKEQKDELIETMARFKDTWYKKKINYVMQSIE